MLVIIDYFSRWVYAAVREDKQTEIVIKVVEEGLRESPGKMRKNLQVVNLMRCVKG